MNFNFKGYAVFFFTYNYLIAMSFEKNIMFLLLNMDSNW